MARLTHPNTVEIYDYGHTDEGMFYYAMEYLPGLSSDELIRQHGVMAGGRVIYLLRQVCGALAEAHAAGMIHRDIKPAKVSSVGKPPKMIPGAIVQAWGQAWLLLPIEGRDERPRIKAPLRDLLQGDLGGYRLAALFKQQGSHAHPQKFQCRGL